MYAIYAVLSSLADKWNSLHLALLSNARSSETQGNFGRHPSSFSTCKNHFNSIGPVVHRDPQVTSKQALLLLLQY